ncbi:hypothetical protein SARC_08672 [Sphaeroforma arctica JP610]|uniref:MFS transporter, AGZA family, xanthine/uracil permease n=1 Tax=Sphaeroforma arctica JP610 TaxID=667725 RepID=A0A0L0FQ43_9EUKA|nr:hypothetical protein SARC_08672 [Sphaeroforma arctica JP610]KNC78917.1 hypothetical protein SARC_08672 [Sphaeroforma arctica JP610]|eukprot:XP_014152819.1 hypothetical protein SARC_08672 [Sphaeroforma arctica JP610]
MSSLQKMNTRFNDSVVGRYFKVAERGSTLTTEIRAGFTTFLTMAYILAVNPSIIGDTGGPCVTMAAEAGTDIDPECLADFKKDLVVATAVASLIACLLMGMVARLPFMLMPGMGMNAYFAYQVVGYMGSGSIPYETALTAVFVEGLIFLFLAVTGLRQYIAELIPRPVRIATSAGIGMFLAFIGFQTSNGIGLVTADPATLVTLGGCAPENRSSEFPVTCETKLDSPYLWIGLMGLFIMGLLSVRKWDLSLFLGIVFVTCISWIPYTSFSQFPDTVLGNDRLDYFKQVIDFHSISMTAGALDFEFDNAQMWLALLTFLYVDLLDTTGTLYSLCKFAGFIDESDSVDFEGSYAAFSVDAVATIIGSTLGLSPVTTASESGSGIVAGGRTGIVALVGVVMFSLSCFFAPIIVNIPVWATGPALIMVGVLMSRALADVDWEDPLEAIPAFVTATLMPFTYSIAYGLIGGILVYVVLYTTNVAWDWSMWAFYWLVNKVFKAEWEMPEKGQTPIPRMAKNRLPHSFESWNKQETAKQRAALSMKELDPEGSADVVTVTSKKDKEGEKVDDLAVDEIETVITI